MGEQQAARMVQGVDWGDGESTTVRAKVVMDGDQVVRVDVEDVDDGDTEPYSRKDLLDVVLAEMQECP